MRTVTQTTTLGIKNTLSNESKGYFYFAASSAFDKRIALALRRFLAATTRLSASIARAFLRFICVQCGISFSSRE